MAPDLLLNVGLIVLAAFFVFTMWRSSRKRKQAAEEAKSQYVPGAEIMTTFGLFGTIKSIESEQVKLEIAPKVVVQVHLRAILKVVTTDDLDAPKSVEEAMARANAEAEAKEAAAGEPQYGERVEPKPVRRTAKKTSE